MGLLQFARRSTLGIAIESTTELPYFGSGADENSFAVRPIALFQHANIFANFLIWTLYLSGVLYVYLSKGNVLIRRKFMVFTVLVVIALVLLSLSRAAMLGILLGSIPIFLSERKVFIKYLEILSRYLQNKKLFILPFFIFFVVALTDRAILSLNSFQRGGGVSVRQELVNEARLIVTRTNFSGVGSNMFIPAAYFYDPNGIMTRFPESVHNGFWLVLVNQGGLFLFFYFTGFFFLLKQIFSTSDKMLRQITLGGFIAQMIIMLFQPFESFITVYLVIVSLVFSKIIYEK